MNNLKYYVIGTTASLSLLILYFSVMVVATGSLKTSVNQFQDMWYWLISLSIGFGIQIGLYIKLRSIIKETNKIPAGVATASGGTSGISMISCCAHHMVEILPVVGLSGAAVFLTNYQIPLITLGIIMNIGGTLYILRVIRKIS